VTTGQDKQEALLSAMTTEHFVLQTAANATVNESASRASLYVITLSSTLIAMGFAANSPSVLVPFVATVLPAVFLLGVLTVLRLVDSALEITNFLTGIARIHAYYRTLAPEAATHFAPHFGRWPEADVHATPVFRLGTVVAFLTTNASMVALINSLVAGAWITMISIHQFGAARTAGILAGAAAAVLLGILFYFYQRWRYSILPPVQRTEST
jgi:hypothetical protein